MTAAKPAHIPALSIQVAERTIDALVPKQLDNGVWYASVVMTAYLQPDGSWHVYDIEKGGHPAPYTTFQRVATAMKDKAGLAL